MNEDSEKNRNGVQSIEVGASLLRALTDSPRAMMLRDLAAAAKMPAAKAHRYLVSFIRMGLVEQDPETGRYDLGAFSLDLGLSALARMEPVRLATPILRSLGESIQQTVAIAVWGNKGPTIVRWFGSDTPVSASLRLGSVMPLTRSATGGAFLAYLPEEMTAPLLAEELAANARLGLQPQKREEVDRWISQTRSHGVSRTSDFIPGISGVAAPVFDYNGMMALALIALGYTANFDQSLKGPLVREIIDVAGKVSGRLGAGRKNTDDKDGF
jgi:DNA-binding IclR family transcriptional regulator